MSMIEALTRLRPGEAWILNGDTYDGLEWLDETAKPTKAEVESALRTLIADRASKETDQAAAREAAIARFKALGFTDAEVAVLVLP